MNTPGLVIREMIFRRWNAALSLLSVATAVASVLGSMLLLKSFDMRSEKIVVDKEIKLQAQLKEMESEYRKITKRMGFNVIILPKDQVLANFYSENYADTYMPEEYAARLSNAKSIVTVRHILPMLQQKMEWPEQRRKVLLIGVQGQLTVAYRGDAEPLVKPVPAGSVALGYELHHSLGIKEGDNLVFAGQNFKVSSLHPERGSIDDITIWIDLAQAQALLHKEKQINCIVALECECAWANLPKVRKEIQGILPDTQVIELAGKALARAEARAEAARSAKQLIENEKAGRVQLRNKREELLAILIPAGIAVCIIWVGLLAWINVRDRRSEIGILAALGCGTSRILLIFLGKAAAIGVIGSLAGIAITAAAGPLITAFSGNETVGLHALPASTILWTMLIAPLATIMASWLPALMASRRDPSEILTKE